MLTDHQKSLWKEIVEIEFQEVMATNAGAREAFQTACHCECDEEQKLKAVIVHLNLANNEYVQKNT